MRIVCCLLTIMSLTSGCSVLDNLSFEPPRYDPTRIYLQDQTVLLRRTTDLSRYACVGAPLQCSLAGSSWHCICE